MSGEITNVIVNHCSPVLLGCKPAALFPLRSDNVFNILSGYLRPVLNLTIVRRTPTGLLVLAFEKARLAKALQDREALSFLAGMGYPRGASLFGLLDYLHGQFVRNDFPHEIGLFLGYPPDDVLGFMRHKGRNYKLCGYWKVYGDVVHARQCFRQYDACRECFKALITAGASAEPQ